MSLGAVLGFLRWDLKHSQTAYEKYYHEELGSAFAGEPQKRKQLVYAYGLHHEKRYKTALEPLSSLLARSGSDADRRAVLLCMGLCLQELERYAEAESVYRAVLNICPDYDTPCSNLGLLLMEQGRYREAEALLRRAADLSADNAHARLNLGALYLKLGQYEKAIPPLKETMALNPKLLDAVPALARCYAALEQPGEAQRYAALAVERGVDAEQVRRAMEHHAAVLHSPADLSEETAALYRAWRERTGKDSIIAGLGVGGSGRSYVGGCALGEAPLDGRGKPMRQLAAIYCEEFPGIGLPEDGLIRIFIAADETWGMDPKHPNLQRGFRVLYDREFDHLIPGPHPGSGPFPVQGRLGLRIHTRVNQPMPSTDCRFEEAWSNLSAAEPEGEFCEAVNDIFHRIGGYPFFAQLDPRTDPEFARYDCLLFQLDSMRPGRQSVWIGDGGSMKFCIPSDKLAAGDFSDVLYWWD